MLIDFAQCTFISRKQTVDRNETKYRPASHCSHLQSFGTTKKRKKKCGKRRNRNVHKILCCSVFFCFESWYTSLLVTQRQSMYYKFWNPCVCPVWSDAMCNELMCGGSSSGNGGSYRTCDVIKIDRCHPIAVFSDVNQHFILMGDSGIADLKKNCKTRTSAWKTIQLRKMKKNCKCPRHTHFPCRHPDIQGDDNYDIVSPMMMNHD